MSEIILLTGGARSGKSELAERLALEEERRLQEQKRPADRVLYVATAAVCDEEMEDRVRKHRERRPSRWRTLEQFWNFEELTDQQDFQDSGVLLLDCLGFMLNNIMYESGVDYEVCAIQDMDRVERRMCRELDTLCRLARQTDKTLIAVTNEVGMSLVPPDRSSRYYRDILGRANRTVAQQADRVYLLVCGIPVQIKPQGDGR